jgi:signal transduction histidine kinase/CheY-like chemotaxis protein
MRSLPRSGLLRVLGGALIVAALGALMFQVATVEPPAEAAQILRLDRARLLVDAVPEREVALPHTWARDGLGNSGRGRYRIEFTLPDRPAVPWGLHASRLSSRHRVVLNERWVHGAELQARASRRGVPIPTWIDLAPDLLRPGLNVLEIEVDSDYRAGLSALAIGPAPALWPAHVRDDALHLTVPRSLNLFGIGLALFLVFIWWRRRSERALGLFAALMALLSIRNVGYGGTGSVAHTPASDAFFYIANVASAWLMARFALAWAERDWPLFKRTMDWGAALLVAAGLVAGVVDGVQTMRLVTYPLLLATLIPSLALMVLGTRREAGGTRLALLAGVAVLCVAPLHDYFYIRGLTSITDGYWMPFVAPVTLMIFAWTLLDRFVMALGAVEEQAAVLEARVTQRTSELAEANAAKTRFLAAASHDLRQPVVAISLLAGLLREQKLPEMARTLAHRIGDSVSALHGLLAGMLDLSRFDAGVIHPEHEAVALRPLLEAALADERPAAQGRGLELRLRCGEWTVQTDRVLLERIVRNLVGNAVRYTDRGGVLVAARRRGARTLRLQVWDTGRGIPLDRQEAVFEEFVRLEGVGGANDAPKERGVGLGLGLSLVRRAAQLLDLPLRLRSRAGRGSCFEIELPLADAPEPAVLAGSPSALGALHGLRVWLVDDEPDVRQALQWRLQSWGAQVQAFALAGAAREAARATDEPPQLLITDQRLPDGQGSDLAAGLRERLGAALPVLLVTGDTGPQDLRQLDATGLATLHKPFDSATLLQALQALGIGLPRHAVSDVRPMGA